MNLINFLGMNLNDVACSEFITSLNAPILRESNEDHEFLLLPAAGIGFCTELNMEVQSIFLHAKGYEGYSLFRGALPEKLSFDFSRSKIRELLLGLPDKSGGGNKSQFFGNIPTWDLYLRPNYALHCQYAKDEASIDLITLMTLSAVPGN